MEQYSRSTPPTLTQPLARWLVAALMPVSVISGCVDGSDPSGGYAVGNEPATANEGIAPGGVPQDSPFAPPPNTPAAPNTPASPGAGGNQTAGTGGSPAVAGGAPAVPTDPTPPLEPEPEPEPFLGYEVSGNQILDPDGNPHRFKGMNRPSFEWTTTGQGTNSAYAQMAEWGANVVRLPINGSFWAANSGNYQAVIRAQVSQAHDAGLDVIIDLHRNDDTEQTSHSNRHASANSVAIWTSIANTFIDDLRVLFELYNEPHDISWDQWRNGDGELAGMQQMYDAVRATGATHIVLVGGLDWAYDLSGIGAGIAGNNIAYVSHVYDFSNKQPGNWPTAFGNLSNNAPIFLTEFGTDNGRCDSSFEAQVLDYADQIGASWTAWAWFPGDCSFPALISDWDGTPTTKGSLIRSRL